MKNPDSTSCQSSRLPITSFNSHFLHPTPHPHPPGTPHLQLHLLANNLLEPAMPLVHLCLPPQIELSDTRRQHTCTCTQKKKSLYPQPCSNVCILVKLVSLFLWRPEHKVSTEGLCPLTESSISLKLSSQKFADRKVFSAVPLDCDHVSTTLLPEATVHLCHYPTWPVFGSTRGQKGDGRGFAH